MNIIGIDPGMSGAIACHFLTSEMLIWDMPTHEITKGKSVRKRLDVSGLVRIFDEIREDGEKCHVFIEQVSAQPGNGAAQAFTFGWGCGALEAIVQCCGMPFTYVTPQKWKKSMQCPANKDGARMRASQMMPQWSHNWQLKKHDGRAEAALIGLYGKNHG